MICLQRIKMYWPVKSVLKCCSVKRFFLRALHFPKSAKVYKNTSKDEQKTYKLLHMWYLDNFLPSKAATPSNPCFQSYWEPLSFFHCQPEGKFQKSNVKGIFSSSCDSRSSNIWGWFLGPMKGCSTAVGEEGRFLVGLPRFFFPGRVELQETDLHDSYLPLTLGPKLITPSCNLV